MRPERGGRRRYGTIGGGRRASTAAVSGNATAPRGQSGGSKPRRGLVEQWPVWRERLLAVLGGLKLALHTDNREELKLGRRHRPDYWIPVLAIALSLIGYVVLFSIVPAITQGDDGEASSYMLKQLLLLVFGILMFAVANKLPLQWFYRFSVAIFVVGLILCVALPILGHLHVPGTLCALGACRWYNLGFATFQPAELLKLGSVLFMASMLATQRAHGRLDTWETIGRFLLVVVLTLGAVAGLQKDLGSGIALAAILMLQLFVSGVGLGKIGAVCGVVLALGVLSIVIAPHRIERVMTFIGGGTEETDYHINQAMIALGSGGLTGRGFGQSVQAFGWLPEAVNDSIFAIYGEMLGWIGVVVLIALFATLLYLVIRKVDYIENYYLRLVVAGVFGWLAAHVLMNIGAMTHMIPLTGITLPLVSMGGTSMAFVMMALGIVFSISHYTMHQRVDERVTTGGNDENIVRWRRERRTHHADRSGN